MEYESTNTLTDTGSLWQLVQLRARTTPDAPMLIDADDRSWTFAEFAHDAERMAAGLHARGIGAGTAVTWQLPTRASTVLLSVALARLGAIQNPVIHLYGRKEVSAILAQSRSAFLIVPDSAQDPDRNLASQGQAICDTLTAPPTILPLTSEIALDDTRSLPPPPADCATPRWVYYTSGTTSAPKGALHTDASLIASGRAFAQALGVSQADVGSIAFPYAHVGGSMYIITLLVSGMSALLLPKFVPTEAVHAFRRHRVSAGGGSTAHYLAWLAEQRKRIGEPLVPTLRVLAGGGAPKPPELYFQIKRELGCTVAHSYGMTEAPMIAGGSPCHSDQQLAYTDGAPVAGMEIRIVRPDGTLAAPGEPGEIRIKGPTVCKGYTDPELTRAAFDEDGFFRTGDLGLFGGDGHIMLTGRLKDVIIRKGENVSAREIENILYQHPKVGFVAVIGLPDRERGERVCAVVELHNPDDPLGFDEMVRFFEAAGTMRQKIPEQLEIVDQLPRNESLNKILKFKLRDMFAKPK
ncbi:MAG: AMP-binding protein [Gammaproteobacteria bacterium]|jgi:acyl-CoA synthetase (AMP-forming)/AMP-acid ligase II|nr:AMP-binding protein [Gammaproteobacteria bacterium]